MKLIIGLGNPEPAYSWTRHNVGKEVVNAFVESLTEWKSQNQFNVQIVKYPNAILAKPLSYMNDVGESLTNLMRYYDVSLEELLVIYDELDLKVGEYKLAKAKGSRTHNGIFSINQHIRFSDYWHMRIGVRDEFIFGSVQKTGLDPAKYVLSHFSTTDKKKIENLIQTSITPDLNEWLSKK